METIGYAITTPSNMLSSAITFFVTIPVDGDWQSKVLWMLIVSFIIAFVLAFAVGANDVANSFGTTVGAGTLTLKQACILASVFETLGAILLGAKVGTTIRKGIIDVSIYNNSETTLIGGEISAMMASGFWQLIATFLKLPVSGTHSIVGATVGFSLVARGNEGVNWVKIGWIVASWFLSPLLAGFMAAAFYSLLRRFIFQKNDPVRPGLISLPIMYGLTIAINCFSVLFAGAPMLGFDKLPYWADIVISCVAGLLVALLIHSVVVQKLKRSFQANDEKTDKSLPVTKVNFGGKKINKMPTLMETISEKDSPEDNLLSDSARAAVQHNDEKSEFSSPPARIRNSSLQTSPTTLEEAKLLRQHTSKRSKSTSLVLSSQPVRIPAVLQLEKSVLKTSIPQPTVREIKEDIRKNFSEPVMANLTRSHDADVYEVYINRSRKLITIHRRNNSNDPIRHSTAEKKQSDQELEKLLSSITPDVKLEDPFDESEDEGLVMPAARPVVDPAPTVYSEAIEKGFRKLSSSQQNIIAIKIGDENEKDLEYTKDDIIETKEGRPEVKKMFSFLQVLTACFGSFAHGGNDVSNAIGPLIAVWIIYTEGKVLQMSATPEWILAYGGVGICVGLWVWGRRVIETMGNDLTNLTPSRGFAIELMSAITVLMASNFGLPVSTTHCKVGAVVAVGWVRAREAVDWKIFRNIVLAWFVTVPVSGGFSAVIFALLRATVNLE